jgi:hypothetical protein
MAKRSKFFPNEITVGDLTEFRAGWNVTYPSSTTRSKVQERLRDFLRYVYAARLIDRRPKLSSITIDAPPTLPLSDAEYKKLLKAVSEEFEGRKAIRAHALIQLMRHSGLAMHDAVTFERVELHHDKHKGLYRVVTSRQKTGTHVSVVIQPEIAKEILEAMKLNHNPKYAFWNSGNGKVKATLTGSAQVADCPLCSEGKKVGYIGIGPNNAGFNGNASGLAKAGNIGGGTGNSVTFSDVEVQSAGTYDLEIDYFTQGPRSFFVTVNDQPAKELDLNGYSFGTPTSTVIQVQLKAGKNQIVFDNPSNYAPDLDSITISPLIF